MHFCPEIGISSVKIPLSIGYPSAPLKIIPALLIRTNYILSKKIRQIQRFFKKHYRIIIRQKEEMLMKQKSHLLPVILLILTLMILCFYSGCGDSDGTTITIPSGSTGPTGSTGATGSADLYDLRIDVTHGGQPVPNFTVTLSRLGTSEEVPLEGADSSGQGWYLFEDLLPGNYNGKISASGFATTVFTVTVPAESNQIGVTIGQWTYQDSGLTQGNLRKVSFGDSNNGWAVGYYADIMGGLTVPLITHTADGTTWTAQTPPAAPGLNFVLYDVSFPNNTSGWAVGQVSTGSSGSGISSPAIIHTPDGTNWAFQTVPEVIDPNAADTGEILNGVDFVSSTAGWAVGGYKDPNDTFNWYPIILRTTDGTTWNIQTPPDPNDSYALNDVVFIDPNTGWAAGSDRIIHTQDGGITWNTQFQGLYFNSIHFIDGNTGWAQGGQGILRTTDGGNTWNRMVTSTGLSYTTINDIFFVDANTGWAAGTHTLVYKNAETDWVSQTDIQGGSFYLLSGLDFINPQRGWAAGYNTDYLASTPVILHYSE